MATLAELETRLELRAARAAGERAVMVQGSRVEMKPDHEIAAAISYAFGCRLFSHLWRASHSPTRSFCG
jgi:hypothetical protein